MYLYFDSKGTLLETINDEALRQYNVGVNTVNVFIEDADNPDSGKIAKNIYALKYWFQLADGEVLNEDYSVNRDDNLVTKTVPFDRNRDLKRFQYGKEYEFFVIEVPCGRLSELANADKTTVEYVSEGDVFKRGGTVLMTIQAGKVAVADSTVISNWLSLERVAFTVEDAVLLPDGIVNSSEFNWLLQQYILGDYLRPQLVYNKIDQKESEDAFTKDGAIFSMQLNASEFNRMPKKDESFLYFYEFEDTSKDYVVMATVTNISDDEIVSAQFDSTTAICFTGATGLEYAIDTNTLVTDMDPKLGINYIKSHLAFYNRTVFDNDNIIYFWKNSASGDTFLVIGSIIDALTTLTVHAILPTRGEKGEQGNPGAWDKSIHVYFSEPKINGKFRTYASNFDQTLNVGQIFSGFIQYTIEDTPTKVYVFTAKVKESGTDVNGNDYYDAVLLDFIDIKGPTGATIVSTILYESRDDGNVYTQTFDDGTTQRFVAPRGPIGNTPNINMSASVDNNVGTPSIEVTKSGTTDNPTFALAFKNIKGTTGTTPNITMSASVDNNVGTPSVTVGKSGTTENPSFNLNFKGLKGGKGDTGATPNITMSASVDNNVGTPSVEVTKSGTTDNPTFALDFKNIKGETGATIISANRDNIKVDESTTTTTISFNKDDGTRTGTVDITAKNAIDTNIVSFSSTATVSSWVSDTKYKDSGFYYRCILYPPTSGTADSTLDIGKNIIYAYDTYVPEVIPTSVEDISSGNFAPFAETVSSSDGIRIYAKKIPTEDKTFSVVLTHIMA